TLASIAKKKKIFFITLCFISPQTPKGGVGKRVYFYHLSPFVPPFGVRGLVAFGAVFKHKLFL
ncbi:MAG: hypothetical protein LBB31_01975, partial [Prevotellaceae bacterium]|nr:hypothetical protein [Prevotellaceae bacterium]